MAGVEASPAHLAVIGAGSRGSTYAGLALEHPEWVKIVAVAEPRKIMRERMQAQHAIPDHLAFESWEQLLDAVGRRDETLKGGTTLDAVIVATQDRDHAAPAIALCKLGYDVLLEKPMAVDEESCRSIASAAEEAGVIFSVCHVLRYMPLYEEARRLLHGGIVDLGSIKMVDHVEPVGHWHWAHSYVRGNWSSTRDSCCSFMAKSCHDIDLVASLVGSRALTVVAASTPSFYSDKGNQPAEAMGATRCSQCAIKSSCVVSAERIYVQRVVAEGATG